ncbi:NAD(P)-dependent oxidoreductase [Amaricoccus solimangrovi]|uniref:NAD(P)-dependent oxidoreductase n=1 Tax=Amaricoccus solimangrovi TaxID=2589815 RepID=A0A501W449_9RHOB|nr:NAD(P)-dependent oxidoreductase [Amaricoccus solimangrovi]
MALIGFGEAAEAFVTGWGAARPGPARAFDVKLLDPPKAGPVAARSGVAGVIPCESPAEALAGAALVLCLVTADQALAATEAAAGALAPGTLWLDGNSCAPDTKRAAAAVIEASGGAYVDMAIMAPVHPRRHLTPVLLAGAEAEAAAAALRVLGMRPEVAGDRVGDASTIKMLRSVMVKGIEALTAECFLAARRAGVDAAVLASLDASDPGMDWTRRGAYNLERMMVHGIRRAAEMREVAATLRGLGLPDRLARATAAWQDEIGALGLDGGAADLAGRADRVLSRLA